MCANFVLCVSFLLLAAKVVAVFLICRCCVSERIPESYLERIPESYLFQVRKKYLDYDTRAQRKEYLLSCKDPRSIEYLFK